MPIAAVPQYLGNNFNDASPGLRFGLLLKLWGVNRRTGEILWTQEDIDYEQRGQNHQEREVRINNANPAIQEACRYTTQDREVMQALLERQRAAFRARGDAAVGLTIQARAVAPFTTGLGNEHPLENGFAFLNPYGLPYLPGSGMKGVLRRAAQDLASGEWGDTPGWSGQPLYRVTVGTADERRTIDLSLIDVLFGRETQDHDKDHVRGALTFWDVIPQIPGDSLLVEVMTPHQSHYYQQRNDPMSGESTTPHDSGQPNPIFFLTVPPGSSFTFHVICDIEHLRRLTNTKLDGAPDLLNGNQSGEPYWKTLITAAFEHAFQWLGFGAKTAVGYGAMTTADAAAPADGTTPGNAHHAQQQAGVQRGGGASLSAQEEEWRRATLTYNPGDGSVTVEYKQQRTAPRRLNQVEGLTDQHRARLKKKKTVTATVVVQKSGNTIELLRVKEV